MKAVAKCGAGAAARNVELLHKPLQTLQPPVASAHLHQASSSPTMQKLLPALHLDNAPISTFKLHQTSLHINDLGVPRLHELQLCKAAASVAGHHLPQFVSASYSVYETSGYGLC